jgi:hypothetical protein
MRDLPSGRVTFLFTDIEGSTRRLEEVGEERYVECGWQDAVQATVTFARARMDDTEFDLFWEEGRKLTVDDAISLALTHGS